MVVSLTVKLLDAAMELENSVGKNSTQFLYIPERYPEKSNLIARLLHNIGTGWILKALRFSGHNKSMRIILLVIYHYTAQL